MKIKLIISIIFYIIAIAIFVISFFTGSPVTSTMRIIAAALVCAGCVFLLFGVRK